MLQLLVDVEYNNNVSYIDYQDSSMTIPCHILWYIHCAYSMVVDKSFLMDMPIHHGELVQHKSDLYIFDVSYTFFDYIT